MQNTLVSHKWMLFAMFKKFQMRHLRIIPIRIQCSLFKGVPKISVRETLLAMEITFFKTLTLHPQ